MLCAKYPAESHTQLIARLLRGAETTAALAGKCLTGGRLNLRNALSPPIQLEVISTGGPAGFGLAVSTEPNRTCVIEAAASLGAWAPVLTNTTDASGRFEFYDHLSPSLPLRFYRASAEP